ncbi:MAG: Trk system potassium transporter TrkA [Lachnospiraceae bacterium]|nr:Trk system potassium transporter TrkA [Lachnospiraceae bacterium]
MGKTSSGKDGLNILIVGGGKIGSTLIEQLYKEGHDITVIDKNASIIQSLTDSYDIMGICGNGASYTIQMEAGIESADLLIAVTDSDELNLLCCMVAKMVGHCSAIARVRTPDYSKEVPYLREKLGLAMVINPEYETAKEISRILSLPSALEVNSFAHGQAELIKFKIPDGNMIDGRSVAELGKSIIASMIICVVERGDEVYIPSGHFVVKGGDTLSFIASRKDVLAFLQQIGIPTRQAKDTMIIGGGKAAYYLASALLHQGVSVKILEKNRQRCEDLSILLPKATVICGDGTEEDLLIEEGIRSTDSFVPLTGSDEENILLTLNAKKISDAKVITKINHLNYKSVLGSLELDSVVYPRYICAEAIVAYVRAKKESRNNSNIETLYHLANHRVEALEFEVTEESSVTGTPLYKLNKKDNLVIACINRDGRIIIPSGQDTIEVGDEVTVVTTHSGFRDLQDILA